MANEAILKSTVFRDNSAANCPIFAKMQDLRMRNFQNFKI